MAVGSTLRGLYALLATFALLAVYVQGDAVGDLQTKGRASVDAAIAKSTTCTKDKVKVRKEWYVPHNDTVQETLLTEW
jgi:tyrosinase